MCSCSNLAYNELREIPDLSSATELKKMYVAHKIDRMYIIITSMFNSIITTYIRMYICN